MFSLRPFPETDFCSWDSLKGKLSSRKSNVSAVFVVMEHQGRGGGGGRDACEGTPVTGFEKLTLRVISCLNLQRYILLNTKCSLSKIKDA